MANNLSSNTTERLLRVFLEKFEANRVISKTIDTQLFAGKFTDSTGGLVSVKRPHDYNTIRTAGGDISSSTKSDIISGKATGVVQDYYTVATEWSNIEEALELDQLDQILAPMATRIVSDLEVDLSAFMYRNAGLLYGAPDTPVDAWSDISGANAMMRATGVPADMERYYLMNDFTTSALADTQSGLASGDNRLVTTAWEDAQISTPFAGLRGITSNALSSFTTNAITGRTGTLNGTPVATYAAAKDTMTQSIAVTGMTGTADVKAGEIIQIAGRFRTNIATRQPVIDAAGNQVLWSGVVTADATLTAGAGTLIVSGPAIFEANGQYNTVTSALTTGDAVTLLGTENTIYQPNLFYHKQAFGMSSIVLPKLFEKDTVSKSEDGISIRVTKYSDGDANQQKIRFDYLPAFVVFNPFFAGQGFGV